MTKLFTLALILGATALTSACTTSGDGKTGVSTSKFFGSNETYQIAGHPYRSDVECERAAPIGEFDRKCDHPRLGFKGFSSESFGASTSGGSSGGPG